MVGLNRLCMRRRRKRKHYYMDIPLDICMYIEESDNKYNAKLLEPKWHEYLFVIYEDFRLKVYWTIW